MNPLVESILAAAPTLDRQLAAHHCERLSAVYYRVFSPATIARHIATISSLTQETPVRVIIDDVGENRVDCTVVAFDYPGAFSLITGLLAAFGISILTGHIFTYARGSPPSPAPSPTRSLTTPHPLAFTRRCIIDYFSGIRDPQASPPNWAEQFTNRTEDVFRLLESRSDAGSRRARQIVNEMVADRLRQLQRETSGLLLPVEIRVLERAAPCTTIEVVAQDTPAFLYSLSNALALRGISIEGVRIQTVHGMVHDEIDLLDNRGRPLTDPEVLNRVRLSVLLTKQFTYFLGKAADPYAALARFDQLVEEIHRSPDGGPWFALFQNPDALRKLAHILGASDYIWEEFVRSQYEALRPLLGTGTRLPRLRFGRRDLQRRLREALQGSPDAEERRLRLNAWKDREIYQIDLDHLLHAQGNPRALAEPLTRLAELVVDQAQKTVFAQLSARYGVPRTVGGLPARHAFFGLGKFGGVALGYASDIELLLIYSDDGQTDGPSPLENREFFSLLAEGITRFISAKQEGIFRVDLRLRPHGSSGPKAIGLETFCRYYGPAGSAEALERLALTRLRWVAGNRALGTRVERLRDEFLYGGCALDLDALRQQRERQARDKTRDGRANAKFSPGALADVECCLQVLQQVYGTNYPELRTPRIHALLEALNRVAELDAQDAWELREAYDFFRRLINALRMLRGNALDLSLPPQGSTEYAHLARRLGYEHRDTLSPEQQLLVAFETHTARVRRLMTRAVGSGRLTTPSAVNLADLLLTDTALPETRRAILRRYGFVDPDRAYLNWHKLMEREETPERFVKLAVLAADALRHTPDPDLALNNWERFVRELSDPYDHFERLFAQPSRLEILLSILGSSVFMAETLIRHPDFLDWCTNPAILQSARTRDFLRAALDTFGFAHRHEPARWLDDLRLFYRREILRIGTRDICLRAPLSEIVEDLSALADVLTSACLDRIWEAWGVRTSRAEARALRAHFAVVGLGKLGGRELNYSSDIDVFAVYEPSGNDREDVKRQADYARVLEELHRSLSAHSDEGQVYRVDLRLRPYGGAGSPVISLTALAEYFRRHAALWELQALLKARPVAGQPTIGRRCMERVREVLLQPRKPRDVVPVVHAMRKKLSRTASTNGEENIKVGPGGIRDIEFYVQCQQLVHLCTHPELLTGNTLAAIEGLEKAGLCAPEAASQLREGYILLRRVEHCLQLFENRQVHTLPLDPHQRRTLARRVMGQEATVQDLWEAIRRTQAHVQRIWERLVEEASAS